MQYKKVFVCLVLAMSSAAFAAAPPPYCLIVTDRCDRLELNEIGGGLIEGRWLNYDCAGSSAFLSGQIQPQARRLVCGEFGPESCPVDEENPLAIVVKSDGDRGVLDVYKQYDETWFLLQSDLEYKRVRGTCSIYPGD